MRTQSIDTHPDIERKQIEIVRGFSLARKFEIVADWMHFLTTFNQAHQRGPDYLIANLYGQPWLKRYQHYLHTHPTLADQPHRGDIPAALLAAIEPLERRGIPYAVAGRLACSTYGLHSSVTSIELRVQHPRRLVLSPIHTRHQESYLDVLHLVRVDVIRSSTPIFGAEPVALMPGRPPIMLLSPEALTVDLMEQFAATGARDDALYNDILGMVKVQAPQMNIPALFTQSQDHTLLARLLDDAGVTP